MDRNKAISFMHDLLRMMVSKDGSDLFITTGSPPAMKIDGKVATVSKQNLSPNHTQMLARSIMNDKQVSEFEEKQECNFSIALPGVARFRVNAFVQRGSSGMVLRIINSEIPSFEELNLPPILQDIAMTKRGLVIFVGGTGSGKSTSLASMVDYRNRNSHGHIITIEDPVEFVHDHRNCLVTQREVGVDTESYEIALKNTLRQAPDVILIGEIRDRETMEHAIAFAETGHLCLSTLHANSTNQALDRIINFFPDERRQQLLMDLSLNTPLMADLIFKGDVHEMKALIAKSNEAGMQTFDQALFNLYEEQKITFEDALRNADSVNDIRLRIKLESDTARKTGVVEDHRDFELEESDDDVAGGMI
jgi:twitching motility protein PilU